MMQLSNRNHCSLQWLLEQEDVAVNVPDIAVNGLTMDSRQVVNGDLFIACAGYQSHGLQFAEQAKNAGAVAILAEVNTQWLPEKIKQLETNLGIALIPFSGLAERASFIADRFYGQPSAQLTVIGITGTNGKTSCSHFIARALSGLRRTGVMGTLGNGYADKLEPSTHTTMDPVSVQAHLAMFVEQQADMVAMEVSSHALQQHRVDSVGFDIAVLTNFSRDHLDYHGSMVEYARVKSLLFKMPGLKAAVINADDELGKKLINDLYRTDLKIIAYGHAYDTANHDACIKALTIKPLPDGLALSIVSSWGSGDVVVPVLGRFNAYNAMVALAVMLETGIAFDDALQRLATIRNVSGRMQMIRAGKGPLVVVDFAHTPDALQQSLTSLREHVAADITCVFGCGGDRDAGKRPLMGAIAEKLSDRVVITDDNPRHEKSADIINDILAGTGRGENIYVESDRGRAIAFAICEAAADDVILIAGKGHESAQIVGDLKLPFSDVDTALKCLEGL